MQDTEKQTQQQQARKPRQPKEKKEKPQKEGKQQKSKADASQRADLTFASSKANFPDWYEELMVTAGVVDKHWDIKGMPIFLPHGYQMHNSIMRLFEEEYAKLGVKTAQFPAFIPRSFLEKEADHVKGFQKECFWHEDTMCLRPTSETAMYHMFAKWVHTNDDLPLMVQQSCNVYRYETKGTKPLIRVREIPWNEAHTAHSTPEEALQFLEGCWEAVHRVMTEMLSVDGFRLRRPDWDRFPGGAHTDVLDVVMPCGRVLQAVGAHYLGQHFSRVFDIKAEGIHSFMTCIGVSTRVLASVLSMHGDDKGLIIPSVIAPQQVVIVPIFNKKTEAMMTEKAVELKNQLEHAGIRTFVDLDSIRSPGEKFFFYEMKGTPIRIEIGPRDAEKGECIFVIRGLEGKRVVKLDEIVAKCQEGLVEFDDALRTRAKEHLASRTVDCTTIEEVSEALSHGGFARIPFYTMEKIGSVEADRIREATGGEIRGYRPLEEKPGEDVLCMATGKPAKFWAYVARAY